MMRTWSFLIVAALAVATIVFLFGEFFAKWKQESRATRLFARIKDLFPRVRATPPDTEGIATFRQLADECLAIINSRRDYDWGTTFDELPAMRSRIEQMLKVVEAETGVGPAAAEEDAAPPGPQAGDKQPV